MTIPTRRARTGAARPLLAELLVPELSVGLALYAAARARLRAGGDRERGDTVQWVILIAIGAAIAITVGTIIYNKLKTKATNITIDTPAPGS